MCPISDLINVRNTEGSDLASNGTMCIKWLDTEQEKNIDVGVGWPYDKLGPYECLIPSTFASSAGVVNGDKIVINIAWSGFWNNLRNQYNEAALENGWNTVTEYVHPEDW